MTEIKSNITCTRCGKDILYCNCENSLRTKMERLEKENAELKEVNRKGFAQIEDFFVQVAELKAQIEKMANCTNCSNFDGDNYCKKDKKIIHRLSGNCSMWELAE